MSRQKIVLMAEFSDIRYDARVLKQASTLAENGFIVHLIMYNSNIKKFEKTVYNNLIKKNIPFVKRYATKSIVEKYLRKVIFLKILSKYFWEIIKVKADYYHAHNFVIGWIVYLSSRIHKSKFIYDAHELSWDEKELHFKMGKHIEKYLLRSGSLILCPSEARSKLIKEFYQLKTAPFPIHNYPSLKEVTLKSESNLRKRIGVSEKTKIIFYSGMLSVHSRLQDNVIKALSYIETDVVFVIIGFGQPGEIDYLKNISASLNLANRIFVLEPLPHNELIKFSAEADVGIALLKNLGLAYRNHALNKFYEYIANGLAVLGSDFPFFRTEIYNNPVGIIGEVCNENDPEDIGMCLNMMLNDHGKLELYKSNSIKLFKNYWNWEREADSLIRSYKGV